MAHKHHSSRLARPRLVLAGISLAVLATACRDDSLAPDMADPAGTVWALSLSHRAVNLALASPYNTLQLSATPVNAFGAPLTDRPAVTFSTDDDDYIEVTPTGGVTAKRAVSEARVVATASFGNLTVTDTVLVRVSDSPPEAPVDSVRFSRASGDTLRIRQGFAFVPPYTQAVIQLRVTDALGRPVDGLLVSYWTSDSSIAFLDRRTGGVGPGAFPRYGPVMLYAEVNAYGVTRRDSIPAVVEGNYRGGFTISSRIPAGTTVPEAYFNPTRITVKAGGMVTWLQTVDLVTDVVFDDPRAADSIPQAFIFPGVFGGSFPIPKGDRGDIAPWAMDPVLGLSGSYRGRVFSRPGLYRFHSSQYGTSALIEVKP